MFYNNNNSNNKKPLNFNTNIYYGFTATLSYIFYILIYIFVSNCAFIRVWPKTHTKKKEPMKKTYELRRKSKKKKKKKIEEKKKKKKERKKSEVLGLHAAFSC